MRKYRKSNKGFTLIELVIVVAVLAILVGLLAPSYTKYVKKSKVTKCEAQRAEIERVYQIACIEDSTLESITDNVDFNDESVINRLVDLGFFKKEEAVCPVYDYNYDLVVTTRNNTRMVEAQCPCVNNVLNYISTAMKLFGDNMNKWLSEHKNYDRKYLIEDFYNELGSLPEVSSYMKQGTGLENKKLYWRPYTLKDGKVILYATTKNDASHGQWRAGLIYKDGKIYQCSDFGKKQDPVGSPIDSLKDVNDADFEKWLTSDSKGQDFKLVSNQ